MKTNIAPFLEKSSYRFEELREGIFLIHDFLNDEHVPHLLQRTQRTEGRSILNIDKSFCEPIKQLLPKEFVPNLFGSGEHIHQDMSPSKEYSRGSKHKDCKLAAEIFLNHNYSGGELLFRDTDLNIKPREKSLLLFNPETYYIVEEVTSPIARLTIKTEIF